jgi:hypothetical protein
MTSCRLITLSCVFDDTGKQHAKLSVIRQIASASLTVQGSEVGYLLCHRQQGDESVKL